MRDSSGSIQPFCDALRRPAVRAGDLTMPAYSVLIVDDEPGIREFLVGFSRHEGNKAEAVQSAECSLEGIAKKSLHFVITTNWLPGL